MLKVVSFKICPFVQRITALLEAKQIPYEIEYISLSDKPQWFLDVSPYGQVPLLITDSGDALFESDAIAEFIDEAYPALQPDLTPTQKALNRAWSYLGSKQYLPQCSTMSSKDGETLIERSTKLATAFAKVEKELGQHRYFNSDDLSMVDMAWLPLLHRADIIRARSGFDMLAGFPNVQAWQQALLATGLAQKSVSEDFIERFSGYYLSENTYLGRCQAQCDNQCDCECGPHNLADCAAAQGCCDKPTAAQSSGCGSSGCC